MLLRSSLTALCLGAGSAVTAQDAAPMSAIDWLSQSVEVPGIVAPPKPRDEPEVSNGAASPSVTVSSLDDPSPDPIGLLPKDVTGLPRNLWALSDSAALVRDLNAIDTATIPAAQSLLMTLLLAEADPPLGAGPEGALFLARVDKLLDIGALDPALAMLSQVDRENPTLFRRWFDVSLLTGAEDDACDVMRDTPNVAPTLPGRIFCLARGGDWPAAALTLNTHRVLGDITPEEEALLSRFLDADLYEDEPPLPIPDRLSPLIFRMHEAIGEPLPTRTLPNAFAHSDLRDTTGWKSQIEAAERLTRVGAISANVLQDLYTQRKPAASGGVWNRVAAVQKFDAAILSGDPEAITARLPQAWTEIADAKLEVPFANLYADTLADLDLSPSEAMTDLLLVSDNYEGFAQSAPKNFATSIALGAPIDPTGPLEMAIYAAFTTAPPAPEQEALARNGNLGEALLQSLATFNAGFAGDMNALTDTLALWRLVGLENIARRAALQLLILDRAP